MLNQGNQNTVEAHNLRGTVVSSIIPLGRVSSPVIKKQYFSLEEVLVQSLVGKVLSTS